MKKRVAIVGGGIYGVTAAIRLSATCDVDLYEMGDDILQAASGINQFRLHRGYHYPRSSDTIQASLQDAPAFEKEYPQAIIDDYEHYYCIAKEGSLTSAEQYLEVCRKFKLEYELADPGIVNLDRISLSIRAKEHLVDLARLKEVCWQRLTAGKVNILLKTKATKEVIDRYDHTVICTYAVLNELLDDYPWAQREYQYELCEKIAVKLPKAFDNKCTVIMDGPFMCVDPFGRTGLFLMGNVVHAIHQTNIGRMPIFDEKYRPLLNRGLIHDPSISRFDRFIESAKEYFPRITEAEYVGSMFTFRTVLPYKEDTDERPKILQTVSDRVVTVFAGKLANCVEAANEVYGIVNGLSASDPNPAIPAAS